jgi:outer membrane lipoprotein SlyB
MRRAFALLAATGALVGLAACGHTTEQKTASGAVAGAVVGGPVGAAVGGAAGNVVGHATDGKR